VSEDDTMQCTVSFWVIWEQGNRKRVKYGGTNLMKTQYIMSEIARQNSLELSIYTLKRPLRS
jgi:hypothetical protein